MRFHQGPYRVGCRIAMQMTSWAGRTGMVLAVETREQRAHRAANTGEYGVWPLPRDTGSLEAPGVYPVLHPCFLIVQFDGPDPQVEGPIEIDGADCSGLVYDYPITRADCLAPYARLPPEVIEAMPVISMNDIPRSGPEEYDCGCVAIERITDRDRSKHEDPTDYEMVRAIACCEWCKVPWQPWFDAMEGRP